MPHSRLPPRSPRLGRWLLLLILVALASVCLNIALLLGRSRPASFSGDDLPHGPLSAQQRAERQDRERDCCLGLRQCQRRNLGAVLQALRGRGGAATAEPQASAPGAAPDAGSPSAGRRPGSPADRTDADAQRSALCRFGFEELRRDWKNRQAQTVDGLIKSLSDRDKQAKDLQNEVDRFAGALDLSAADRERLATHYGPLRNRRIAAVLQALDRQPPDHRAVFDQARGLVADQDRLIRELFGSDKVAPFRAAELRSRTIILAILATHADLPWDDTIAW
jgi:hypothetical protein